MKSPTLHRHAFFVMCLIAPLFILGCATARKPSPSAVNPADVDTIGHIIQADYDCLSGPAGVQGQVRQKERDNKFYIADVRFVSVFEEKGQMKSQILTQDEYWGGAAAETKVIPAGYETEVGRRTERYGNVAQVRSISVGRDTPDGPVTERYLNYSQLYWDGTRWWIAGQVWQKESPNAPIPESWIGRWEEVMH
jgi:hypothetical protein